MIVSFYTDNIDPEVVAAQKSVFDYFGIAINQIKPELWHGHAGAIDRFLSDYDWKESIIIMDIDCIPTQPWVIQEVENAIVNFSFSGIFSVAQKASHIPGSPVYASPAFIAFNKLTYDMLGRPSFAATDRSDCGGELTYAARDKGIEIRLLYPSHVEVPLWDLDGPFKFGKGTTYGNRIYHAFYSRKDNGQMFIDKCKSVIK